MPGAPHGGGADADNERGDSDATVRATAILDEALLVIRGDELLAETLYTRAMPVTVDLPADLLVALEAEAQRRQMTVEALIAESVSEHVSAAPRRRFALAGVGSSTGTRFARDADEMLAEGFGRD